MSTETITPALRAYRELLERWANRAIECAFEEDLSSPMVAQMAMIRVIRDAIFHGRSLLANRFTHMRVCDEDDRTMIRVTDHFQGISYECYRDYDAMEWIDKQQEVFPV